MWIRLMVREPFVQVWYIVLYEEFGYFSKEVDCGGGEGFLLLFLILSCQQWLFGGCPHNLV